MRFANTIRPAGAPATIFVLGLAVAQLVSWGSALYSFALFLEPIEHALGIGRSASSLAFSLGLLVQGLAGFSVGRWIDHGHERLVMTAGSLLLALGLVAQGLAQSLAGLYVAWVLIGLGMATTFYTPAFAVITRRHPGDYRRLIITMTFLGGLASTVFIPFTDLLVRAFDWRTASCILALPNLFLCMPLHAILLRNAPRRPVRPDNEARASMRSLRAELRSPVYWRLGAFTVLLLAVTAALPPHLVSLLRESGLPPAWAIAVPASIGVLQVFGRVVLYLGERSLDAHATNRWAPVLVPLALVALLAGSGQMGTALAFALLFGVGNGMLTIVVGTIMAQYVGVEHVGALNGALGLPLALARAAAPLAVGMLWSPAHGYAPALVLLIALGACGVALLWSGQELARKRAPGSLQ